MKLKRVLMEVTAIVIVILLMGMAFEPSNSYNPQINTSGANIYKYMPFSSSSKSEKSFNNCECNTSYIQIGDTNITILTIEFHNKFKNGFTIFTFVNCTFVSFVSYKNNVKKGEVQITTFENNKFSYYTGKLNESFSSNEITGPPGGGGGSGSYLPVGTYSSGGCGWAYSFNNYNTNGLIKWIEVGAAVSFFVVVLVTAGLGWPIATIVAAALVAVAQVLGLINWEGGYQGIYVADTTGAFGIFSGHPYGVPWVGANPVPSGY
jgi:hypothetical protein